MNCLIMKMLKLMKPPISSLKRTICLRMPNSNWWTIDWTIDLESSAAGSATLLMRLDC
ncbi:hypothetical protein BD289DRAFT_439723 [Coniella lustricola]|uniref:Uncharacterized protein n=1 Tax=Coniella lustricola TaxID=2025994 RepID=A0A2T3A181_9PEZI|nr:hypothetical protein BD289DRAFT_439723 [Coniella lustricola]